MELIDKKKIYKEINIRDFVENEEADITINDKILKNKEEYKCIQCSHPVDLPFSICKECQDEAARQHDEYIQHWMREANKNETCS